VKFGPVPIDQAEGAILAHATNAGERRFRKAHRLEAADIAALQAAGVTEVVAAVLGARDLGEDAAAGAIARAMRHRDIEAKAVASICMRWRPACSPSMRR
jgi:molybdenum cofactor cytidylyltransferase